jgi:hypothetical protein
MENNLLKIENTLRNFICHQLKKEYSDNWEKNYGVSNERIVNWTNRLNTESKKFKLNGTVENRLIYYSDFYDLLTIISKNWQKCFHPVFDNKKETEIFLKKLDDYRNVEAHRRELLSHQKLLLQGIVGELTNKIIRYKSKMEHDLDIFPRLERITDNFGNIWSDGERKSVETNVILHPGDILEFSIDATDPENMELEYCIQGIIGWEKEKNIKLKIEEKHIALRRVFAILMKSKREYHSHNERDGEIHFVYKILPNKEAI